MEREATEGGRSGRHVCGETAGSSQTHKTHFELCQKHGKIYILNKEETYMNSLKDTSHGECRDWM